jgi:hypothetical protein
MDGGGAVGTYLKLFGSKGLKLAVIGLCDEDKEPLWLGALQAAGYSVTDRASMKNEGFLVCLSDLEDEFVRALGATAVEAVIAKEGRTNAFVKFQQQPAHVALKLEEQLQLFLHKDNTQWAVPLVDALDLKAIPGVLSDIFAKL